MRQLITLLMALTVLSVGSISSYAGSSGSGSEIEDIKRQIREIQRQNDIQIEALKTRIEELESKQAEAPNKQKDLTDKVEVGYEKGFYIKTKDKDKNWMMKFNARLQFRLFIDDFDQGGSKSTDSSFQIRRARLSWSGNAFRHWIKYKIQIAADRGDDFNLKDFLVDFAPFKEAGIMIGQYKVPFNREELNSSSALVFVDRSIVNDEFSLGRDVGVQAHGIIADIYEWHGGIFSGTGALETVNGRSGLQDDFLYIARLAAHPFGYHTPTQGQIENLEDMEFAIGAGIAAVPTFEVGSDDAISGEVEGRCESIGVVDGEDCRFIQFTADGVFKHRGFAAEAEFHVRNAKPDDSALEGATDWGYRVQASYFHQPSKLQLALRYAYIDYDDDNLFDDIDALWEITPALTYYIYGNHLKVQAAYSFIRQELLDDNVDINRVRLQVQFYF